MENIIDTAVVGAGVAGLSAALFLARAGKSTITYDGGIPRIFAVERVREFPGFDGLAPAETIARIRDEAVRYGAVIRNAFVTLIEPRTDGMFDVWTAEDMITARSVVLATGLKDELPTLHGVPEIWGRYLRICPCFDGYEVRNQRFVVFGLAERLVQMASWVRVWSPHVTVVSGTKFDERGEERLRLLGIDVVPDEVTGVIHRNQQLIGVSIASGSVVTCDAAWIASAFRAFSNLAAMLCDVDELGFAKTDADGRTSRPGVFAIGNASNPVAHLAHAAAAGAHTGPVVTLYLLESTLNRLRGAG
jgi:thioredoxin reductase